MDINRQQKAPIYEALEEFKKEEWFHLTCLGTKEAETGTGTAAWTKVRGTGRKFHETTG